MIVRHVIGLAIALALTWMIFFGAGYFGAVWTHYFADKPEQKNTGEVSVKILPPQPVPVANCTKDHPCPAPHE
jgi:uncharacterized protein involved in cysteine biosynthesis